MSLRLATVGYIPPSTIKPEICSPSAFVQSLAKYKLGQELILFSDSGEWEAGPLAGKIIPIPDPEQRIDREARLPNGMLNTFALNNLLFFTALRIAKARDITHMLYIEADCRFGKDNWDDILFEAHFRWPQPPICSGSVVCFNPCCSGLEACNRWHQYITQTNIRRNYPVPTYGWTGQSGSVGAAVFTNGALGVYDLRWLNKFFPEVLADVSSDPIPKRAAVSQSAWAARLSAGPLNDAQHNSVSLAERSFAWDFAIGDHIWKNFGVWSYECVAHIPQVFSSYGNVLTTEEQRMTMLRNGEVIACHQCKSNVF